MGGSVVGQLQEVPLFDWAELAACVFGYAGCAGITNEGTLGGKFGSFGEAGRVGVQVATLVKGRYTSHFSRSLSLRKQKLHIGSFWRWFAFVIDSSITSFSRCS